MILRADARAIPLRDSSIDAIITDPPYGLGFMGKSWDREFIELRAAQRDGSGPTPERIASGRSTSSGLGVSAAAGGMYDRSLTGNRGFQAWSEEWAREVLRVAKPGAHLAAFGGTRTFHRLACAIEDAGWEIRDCLVWIYGSGFPKSLNGPWGGTALKPGWEPILLARKPLIGTVAENVQAHGTGGLNIDACRLPISSTADATQLRFMNRGVRPNGDGWGMNAEEAEDVQVVNPAGRWPPNVALDEEAAALLDQEAGDVPGQLARARTDRQEQQNQVWGPLRYVTGAPEPRGDSGGPSRFFYCPKASRAEREAGCENLPTKTGAAAVDRQENSDGLNSPRAGSGRTASQVRNDHPTVKPLALMRWLCRLITPVGGTILDPFAGSGSTACAAAQEGLRSVSLDLDPHYTAIAQARIAFHAPKQLNLLDF